MSTLVPPRYAGLVDDASALPPSSTGVPDALVSFREREQSWFADLTTVWVKP